MNVEHEEGEGRFIVRLGDEEAELAYTRPGPKLIDIQHTYVPKSGRGRGVAEELAKTALQYAREHRYRVIPSCPFVRRWLQQHPEEADVVDPRYTS